MEMREVRSRILKPLYEGKPPPNSKYIPLSVFDKVTFDTQMAVIYAYHPPTPPNSAIELGLRKALSVYPEFSGRLGKDDGDNPVILLNDKGIMFVEAFVDTKLDQDLLLDPSVETLLSLHPDLENKEELVQVQLTRFTCGSLVVGFTKHHLLSDGHSGSGFLVAWGQACRGVDITTHPFHDRSIICPRNPPIIKFAHKGVEYIDKKPTKDHSASTINNPVPDILVHKAHFTSEFISKLKANASSVNYGNSNRRFTTVETLVAHLWRCITRARGLKSDETTHCRIAVDGRTKLVPNIPTEYIGNLVLWAYPNTKVKDLIGEPLSYAANLIQEAVAKMNDEYFRSFIDFASYKVKKEDLVPTTDVEEYILSPNIEVDSILKFPFNDLDFGSGRPYILLTSCLPAEGLIFLVPSAMGDQSVDAFMYLFPQELASFKEVCYSLHNYPLNAAL